MVPLRDYTLGISQRVQDKDFSSCSLSSDFTAPLLSDPQTAERSQGKVPLAGLHWESGKLLSYLGALEQDSISGPQLTHP